MICTHVIKCSIRPDRIHERLMMSDFPESDTDISFVSSDRTSVDRLSVHYDYMDSARTPRMSTSSDHSFGSVRFGQRMNDMSPRPDFSFMSQESGMTSSSSLPRFNLHSAAHLEESRILLIALRPE